MVVGSNVGFDVGQEVGSAVGSNLGLGVGHGVGTAVGSNVGRGVGKGVGSAVGINHVGLDFSHRGAPDLADGKRYQ